MSRIFLVFILGTFFVGVGAQDHKIVKTEFQEILDEKKVIGSILIYDLSAGRFYSNDFAWAETGQLPASTFKIPNSIVALELGVVKDDSTIFKWDGVERSVKNWNQDLIFRNAFHYSCVPCYQDIARKVGVDRMRTILDKMQYPGMQFSSETIDNFWLMGDSRISPMQQIAFLRRYQAEEIPLSTRTYEILDTMMIVESTAEYTLRAKSGWSVDHGHNNGWYVGYVEKESNVYFFATNIEPVNQEQVDGFVLARIEVTRNALAQLEILPPKSTP